MPDITPKQMTDISLEAVDRFKGYIPQLEDLMHLLPNLQEIPF